MTKESLQMILSLISQVSVKPLDPKGDELYERLKKLRDEVKEELKNVDED